MLLRSVIWKNATGIRAFASMKEFDYQDPLWFDDLLTDEERLIWDTAWKFVDDVLMKKVIKGTWEEKFDTSIMKEYGNLGFLGATLNEYDLPGVSSASYGLISREVERCDSGYRSALSV